MTVAADSLTSDEGLSLVKKVVATWTQRYEPVIQFSGRRANDDTLMYTAMFSMPDEKCPVPISVLQVYFYIRRTADSEPTVEAHFAHGDLKHKYSVATRNGKLEPSGGISFAKGKFEKFIDRLIKEKTMVRDYQDMCTEYEKERLVPPETYCSSDEDCDSDLSQMGAPQIIVCSPGGQVLEVGTSPRRQSLGAQYAAMSANRLATIQSEDDKRIATALREAGLPCYEKISFAQLLFNIFDAADENDEGELQHREILSLLIKTFANDHLGLRPWDMRVLTRTVHENEEGKIAYKIFVQEAPEIIESLRVRRAKFEATYPERAKWDSAQALLGEGPVWEAVRTLYKDELAKNCEIIEALEAQDPEGMKDGFMSRSAFERALYSHPERFSPQEIGMIMQYMPQSEENNLVEYSTFQDVYTQLRCDQLHNGLLESDIENLRKHLIILLRRNGLPEDETLPLRVLKQVLLQADQLNLSRMQVHVLLSMQLANFDGIVSVEDFLTISCSVIPTFFDPVVFLEKAEALKEELEAQKRARELRELEALTGQQDLHSEESIEGDGRVVDNRADLERALIQLCASLDEGHRGVLPIDTMLKALSSDWDRDIEGGLSKAEGTGLAAELNPEGENREVAYVDHVRTWMPIIMELRQSTMYKPYLVPNPFQTEDKEDGIVLADLFPYAEDFPLFPPEQMSLAGSGKPSVTSQLKVPGSMRHSNQQLSAHKSHSQLRRRSTGGNEHSAVKSGTASIMQRRMSLQSSRRQSASKSGPIQTRRKSMLNRSPTTIESSLKPVSIRRRSDVSDFRARLARGVERRRRNEERREAEKAAKEESAGDDKRRSSIPGEEKKKPARTKT